jgi:hypothetical protein
MLEAGFQPGQPGLHTAVERIAADLHPQAPNQARGLG